MKVDALKLKISRVVELSSQKKGDAMAHYHPDRRNERYEAVANMPNEWTLDTMLDLLEGLLDHVWPIQEVAVEKLLELACNPDITPLILHPKELAYRYVVPGTYAYTLRLVRVMKDIGLPAKDVCENFFKRLKRSSRLELKKSLQILEGSLLYEVAKCASTT
jgi:hypothetical protein